jgi:2-dehydropantoate 2-reductase
VLKIAVLGPGGVGGLVAGALDRAGTPVRVIARESTARLIDERGLRVSSVRLGDFLVHPRATAVLGESVDVLIVSTKAAGLTDALERVTAAPKLVLPLLNGLDHLAVLRARFDSSAVVAATIRVEADRPEPGVVVHTSRFLRIDMAYETAREDALEGDSVHVHAVMDTLAQTLERAGVPARVLSSEAQVMWSKLVRLNALACVTSAFEKLLGEIRDTPELREELMAAIAEGCAVAGAEGASIDPSAAMGELTAAHDTLGSSMQRDIAAGRTPELDAIPGAVLRAAARNDLECPTIARLAEMIAARAGLAAPVVRR